MTTLRQAVQEYLNMRRALGFLSCRRITMQELSSEDALARSLFGFNDSEGFREGCDILAIVK